MNNKKKAVKEVMIRRGGRYVANGAGREGIDIEKPAHLPLSYSEILVTIVVDHRKVDLQAKWDRFLGRDLSGLEDHFVTSVTSHQTKLLWAPNPLPMLHPLCSQSCYQRESLNLKSYALDRSPLFVLPGCLGNFQHDGSEYNDSMTFLPSMQLWSLLPRQAVQKTFLALEFQWEKASL